MYRYLTPRHKMPGQAGYDRKSRVWPKEFGMTERIRYDNIIPDNIQALFRARNKFKPSGIACERFAE